MTVRFRNLTLVNFGPYRGRQEVNLATDSDSPVVLIYGENTLGKTQLFSALRWCLYGTFEPQQSIAEATKELPDRLNSPARREGETTLEVTIEFDANGHLYHLTRRAELDGKVNVGADLRIDATVIPAAGIDREIGQLLHPQISEFFLFDAELMKRFYERLATDRERAFIKESIEAVLGIPALQRAQRDVQDLANDALQRQAKLAKGIGEAEKIQKELKELKSLNDSIERDRNDLNDKLGLAEMHLREVRDQLKVVEGLQADVREQELLEANLADGRREEDTLKTDMKTLLSSGWKALALPQLAAALGEVQTQNSEFQRHQKRIGDAQTRVEVLKDRAKGGKCPTCKQALPPPGKGAAKELSDAENELETILAETGGGRLDLERERRIGALIDRSTIDQYRKRHQRLTELQLLQYERKQTLESINDRLQGHSAADIRALGFKNKELEQAIEGIRKALEENDRNAQMAATRQQRLARQLDKLPGAKPEIIYEAGFFRYADELLQSTIDAYRERVRAEVEADAKEMFLKLIRDPAGYGGLRIASDYKIDILDKEGRPRVTSEGGKQLLALSFIGALKKAAVRGGAVVLDSPLGRLDLEHRANVLQTWIPSLGVQAILLVQSGELTKKDAGRLLGSTIGHAYELVRPTGDPEQAVIQEAR
jgi:DNA sulfur modification protein DndD